jgi:16S rRNA (uracil1498-N3)-methyltransferase
MPSYYFPELDKRHAEVVLDSDEHHHLSRVKRARAGQMILLNNGKGLLANAEIVTIDKKESWLRVVEFIDTPLPEYGFSIAFSLLKNQHDEMIVEKCTELGAREFFPLICENTVRTLGKNTVARFEKTALAAIKQCDNPFLPVIHEPKKLDEALTEIKESYLPVVAYENEDNNWLKDISQKGNMCFIIGPEGGFDPKELYLFEDLPKITLSKNILRAETAAITAAAQFQIHISG